MENVDSSKEKKKVHKLIILTLFSYKNISTQIAETHLSTLSKRVKELRSPLITLQSLTDTVCRTAVRGILHRHEKFYLICLEGKHNRWKAGAHRLISD